MPLIQMDWPYFTLHSDGVVLDDDGVPLSNSKRFLSIDEVESHLIDHDIRGSVKPEIVIVEKNMEGEHLAGYAANLDAAGE